LNIHLDPWDNYLYHDSKFLLNYIFNQGNELAENKFLQLKFLLFVYYNDLMANFKVDGKIVADRILKIIDNQEETKLFIHDFVKRVLIEKKEPKLEEVEKFETKLEIIFDLFIEELSSKGEFSEVKEDYFKI
jgi:hypothetical protein